MADAITCPICNREVTLTVFGALPSHGGKKPCSGSGYTVKEAAAMTLYSDKRK